MADSRKKRKNYSDQSVIEAVAAVKNGDSFRKAASKYNVPVTTVRDRFHAKYTDGKNVPGPAPGLTFEQERILKSHLLHMDKIGYGIPKKDVAMLIKEILDKAEIEDPASYNEDTRKFKENMPSTAWIYRFIRRNPECSTRTPENLGYQRSYVNEAQIRNWFKDLEKFFIEQHGINATDFFSRENSSRIFNLDESGFPLSGTNGKLKIISTRGSKNVYRLAPDSKEQVTVLGCVSAAGEFSNPFVIFPGIRPKFNLGDVDPNHYDLGTSQNGWISADCFFEWLANIFFPSIKDKVTFPVVILMDGHTSHINIAVSSFCREHDIILYCFPPHASHIMQPLDVSVYGPLKKHWNDSLNDFSREYKGLAMSRTHFFKVFDHAWKQCIANKQNVMSGFRKCGLVPFNPNAVAYDRLISQNAVAERFTPIIPTAERVGIARLFQVFEDCLSDELRRCFQEGKNVDESIIRNIYFIYKLVCHSSYTRLVKCYFIYYICTSLL